MKTTTNLVASFLFLAGALSLSVFGLIVASQEITILGIACTIVAGLVLRSVIR